MQKLAKRAAQAQRNVAKRRAKVQQHNAKAEALQYQQSFGRAIRDIKNDIHNMRRDRREAWEKGPLAPKRQLPFNTYGMVQEDGRDVSGNHHKAEMFVKEAVERRTAWAGGVKKLCLTTGDRVVLLTGPAKGKIDSIKSIDTRNGTITLEKYMKALRPAMLEEATSGQGHEFDQAISISDVRLVYPLTNPDTGVTRDVVINELRPVPANMQSPNMTFERWEYGIKHDRLIPASNTVIPWPETEAPELVTHDADTARDTVEDRTFYYNLTSPPMPNQIIDELRNKYSKFRTRHEASYVAKKEAEEAVKKGRTQMLRSMQTPLQELHEKKRLLRQAEGEPELTEDMLTKIGQVMAKNQATSGSRAQTGGAPPDPPTSSAL